MISNNNAAIVVPPKTSTASATNDILAAKPPVPVPNDWAWVWWAGGALLLGLASWAAYRRWRKKSVAAKVVPVIPPHVRAKQKLAAALQLISDPKAFCTAVSDTLRVYLEERFSLHAPERTTEEFLFELQSTHHLTPDQKISLVQFLQSCDLVKFARFEPEEENLRALHDSALRLVEETQFEQVASAPAGGLGGTPPLPPPPIGEKTAGAPPPPPPITPAGKAEK